MKFVLLLIIFIMDFPAYAEIERDVFDSNPITEQTQELRSFFMQLNYAKASDISAILRDKNNALLSASGSVSIDARTNTIWVRDLASQLVMIKRVIHKWDAPVKQVLIEARIVNMNKDCMRDLGVRFVTTSAQTVNETNETNFRGDHLNIDLSATPLNGNPATIGFALAKLGNGVLLDLELSALESEGRGEVIASPRLITANQQTAIIESGEEVPYQETTRSGATSVTFKKAVLSLKVTPQITSDSTILMALDINQDMISPKQFNGVPAILTREIKTNVLVNNHQTIVLGGIYKQNKNKVLSRIPFLGDLPIVGGLFRKKMTALKNEELLIFITPSIINDNKKENY